MVYLNKFLPSFTNRFCYKFGGYSEYFTKLIVLLASFTKKNFCCVKFISLMFNKIQKKIGKPNLRQSNLSMSKADVTVNQKQ